VAEIAVALATTLGLGAESHAMQRRAALLHDVGKLGVSNRILDKTGPLSETEWAVMRCQPRWSKEILNRVGAFHDLAQIAGSHHERLDGSGYFAGLTAPQLGLPARILAVADVAEALSADRPYRSALSPDDVLDIMRRDAGPRLDPDVFAALEQVLPAWTSTKPG
jgi:HD-GYP domain-containing protein (c-di-GMP phosphodiesterase class II)